jgi:hypothetical protein
MLTAGDDVLPQCFQPSFASRLRTSWSEWYAKYRFGLTALLCCVTGCVLLWWSFGQSSNGEKGRVNLLRFFGIILNLPLLGFLYRSYHWILGPVSRTLAKECVSEHEELPDYA